MTARNHTRNYTSLTDAIFVTKVPATTFLYTLHPTDLRATAANDIHG